MTQRYIAFNLIFITCKIFKLNWIFKLSPGTLKICFFDENMLFTKRWSENTHTTGEGASAPPQDPHPAIFIILRITYVKKVLKSYWEIYYFFQRKWQIRTFWFIRGFFLWIFDLNYHPTDYFRPITCRFSRFLTPWKLFRLFQPYFWSFLLNHASF